MSKTFKEFPSGHEAIRHVDVTMTLCLSGVVIRGLPGGGVLFYCQTVENMFADDKLIFYYIQNYVERQQHVHLLETSKRCISVICR